MKATIENVINHINSVKKGKHNKQGICVLLGAGADISSGGVLFRKLKLLFLKENGCIVPESVSDRILDEKFEQEVKKLSQNGRCETLDKIMRNHCAPSEGYSLLVVLAEMGYIDAVITTNFDYLLEETQKLLNINPFTIYTPGRAIPQEYYLKRNKVSPVYLKMHGDLYDRFVTHLTLKEIQNNQYMTEFIKLFKNIIKKNSVIIVGYGGYDTLIADIFKQEMDYLDEVYWCNISEPNDDSKLAKALNDNNKLYYINTSFDNFFQRLAKSFLKDAKLKNANPIFLPTVIQSKIENQKYLYTKRIKNKEKLLKRSEASEIVEDFLQTFDNKCIAITGEYKYGKSCFIYKIMQDIQDVTFFPIIYNYNYSILENMAQALGYDTDIPLSVMYSFLKWWDEKKEQLVFVIDDVFNKDCFDKIATNYVIEFFNFLYIAREFKYIQFIICFQSEIYDELEKNSTFVILENIISHKIKIEQFSEDEVVELLDKNGINNDSLKKQKLLRIPYVWEILNKNNIIFSDMANFFSQYVNALYNISIQKYRFSRHAMNAALMKLAYNQLFAQDKQTNVEAPEYNFLKEEGIININNEIVYPELITYFCSQYFLKDASCKDVISKIIIPKIQETNNLSDMQTEVFVSIFAKVEDINNFDFILKNLEKIMAKNTKTNLQKKFIIKVLYRCFEVNAELFENYLMHIDINTYSFDLQRYLFKVCAQVCPTILKKWEIQEKNVELSYTAFIMEDDMLYNSLLECIRKSVFDKKIIEYFEQKNGLLKLCHMLTYWGWDNLTSDEYNKLNNIIINNIFPVITVDDKTVQYFVNMLQKYAYNIFFNAGDDFEEQFVRCQNKDVLKFINNVLDKKVLTENEYKSLIEMNTDINNSWLFIISNIILVQAMNNYPTETYDMLYHFFDDIQFEVQVQHLDFFLSNVFWALYLNVPCDREKFTTIFEKIVRKFERILFMFPNSKRNASLNKFSEEFDRMFEDGFNPIAFYFYTAPYKSLVENSVEWNNGKIDLEVYWNLAQYMSDYGKYDEIIRIVHALGQMISIYPEEGYLALENLVDYEQPIIKKGIVRVFKENYLRYSKITKKELEKNVYHLKSDEIEEIIYNTEFLLANRTLEQLHWGRLFYNLEQLMNISVSEKFLSGILCSQSSSGFLCDFIKNIFK